MDTSPVPAVVEPVAHVLPEFRAVVRWESSHSLVNRREGRSPVAIAEEVGEGAIEQERRETIDFNHVPVPEATLVNDQPGAGSDAPRVRHHDVDTAVIGSRNAMQGKRSDTGQRYGRTNSEQRGSGSRLQLQQIGGVHDDTSPRLRQQPTFKPFEDLAST